MGTILDMSNLREIIDNDRELEQELVKNFHVCYDVCVAELEAGIVNHDNVMWRNAAHALKGIAFNLGAQDMGELSLKAERACEAPYPEKVHLLSAIKASYGAVNNALRQMQCCPIKIVG